MGVEGGELEVRRFSDGETYAKFHESVRGADCYVIQPTSPPVDQNLMELLILLDALKRASAARVTAVVPYYGYGRQEKKIRPREAITARLVADMLVFAGAHRVMTMDLHADAIQGFFSIPVDHLTGLNLIAHYFDSMRDRDLIIVSPDEGRVKKVRKVAGMLDKPIAVGYKYRPDPEKAEITHLAGDVAGKIPVIVDDMITTGGSVMQCVKALLKNGCAPEIYIAATHGVLVGEAIARLSRPEIAKVIITDTIPLRPESELNKLVTLSVAPLFAEAIARSHRNESISNLFE